MPPRRNHLDLDMGELQRENQRLLDRLAEYEGRSRGTTPPVRMPRTTDENPFHQEYSSEEEARPRRFGVTYQRRAPDPPHHDFGVKIDLPEFEGRMEPEEFVEWLQTVERIFEYKDVPEDRRVKLAAIKLKRGASLWWENLKRARLREGRSKITSWDKMKRELQRKYLPAHYRQDLFLRLHNLQQRESSVETYTTEFEQLMLRCDLTEPEEHTVARYLGGLRPAIGNVVQLQPYWTLMDVQTLAMKVERQQKNFRVFTPAKPSPVGATSSGTQPAPVTPPLMGARVIEEKKPERGSISSTPPARRCFKCHGFGHIASNCPTRNLISFTEQGAVEIEEEEEQSEQMVQIEEVQLQADDGELLMLQKGKLLQAESPRDQLWLRHNIFRTRCTVKGKVCTLIIDGGSCENVVSSKAVKKLSLTTEKHKEPYSLSWLNQGSEVRVTKRCLVEFSIGGQLQEEVWCDVVPMDAGHILLGRPWQYDRQTVHDGFNNTYSLMQNGKRVVLLPWKADIAAHTPPTPEAIMIRTTLLQTKTEEPLAIPPDIGPVPEKKAKPPEPRENDRGRSLLDRFSV